MFEAGGPESFKVEWAVDCEGVRNEECFLSEGFTPGDIVQLGGSLKFFELVRGGGDAEKSCFGCDRCIEAFFCSLKEPLGSGHSFESEGVESGADTSIRMQEPCCDGRASAANACFVE